jgi:cathepsin L
MNRESYSGPSTQSSGRYIPEDQKTISIDGVMVPTYINWREMNAVTPIKDQFKCNACYAFSAIGALESHHKIRNGDFVNLAEQEIVDCSRENKGCVGGLPHLVFDYIRDRGISYTNQYRYDQSRHSPCRRHAGSRKFSGSNIRGYRNLRKGILNLIKELSNGPVATISYASFPFKQYRGGIYRGQGCYGKSKPNHSSVLIGYKLTGDRKYLYFKNGWGTNWGESGYYKVQLGEISNRNRGHCMIAATSYNSIPRV